MENTKDCLDEDRKESIVEPADDDAADNRAALPPHNARNQEQEEAVMTLCIRPVISKLLAVASVACVTAAMSSVTARGQCTPGWLPGDGYPGIGPGSVDASVMWDPDGAGPLSPVLVVSAPALTAGSAIVNNIAAWDGTSWSALGAGLGNGSARDLAVAANGDLIVVGGFNLAGGTTANNVARWNGTQWSTLGTGLSGGSASAVAVLPNGDIVVGGQFTSAGGVPVTNIARWDGTSWWPLGTGIVSTGGTAVVSMAVLPSGDLVVGGQFTSAGDVPANRIARWDGTSWSAMGSGMDGVIVSALTVLPNGDLIAGGDFSTAGGNVASRIARWDGAGWSPLGGGVDGSRVYCLATSSDGSVIAGGTFAAAGGVPALNVARWDGTTWSAIGTGVRPLPLTLTAMPNGQLAVGGAISSVGSGVDTPIAGVAVFDGTDWRATAPGTNSSLYFLAKGPNGDVVAGGDFGLIEGVTASNRIARWNGSAWSALGSGSADNLVQAAAFMPNGDIIAAGKFTTIGGVVVNKVARWDGFSWSALGTGLNNDVNALAVLPNGDLIAGGTFTSAFGSSSPVLNRVARWDGASWSPMQSGMSNTVNALAVLPNGDLVAGGNFTSSVTVSGSTQTPASNRVIRWNGTAWSTLGTGVSGLINALLVLPNGDLLAGGAFASAGGNANARYVARWNGTAWSPLGTGITTGSTVNALAVAPSGDVLVAGEFTVAGGIAASRIARWNGAAWQPLGAGTNNTVRALAVDSSGVLLAGGAFVTAGATVSAFIARWRDCGVCCSGSGFCTLVSSATECLGGTFQSQVRTCEPGDAAFALAQAAPVTVDDSAGNATGIADPGESGIALTISVVNSRPGFGCDYTSSTPTATSVTATLTSLTPTATVTTGSAAYPDMLFGAEAGNLTPFVIALDNTHACGAPVNFRLTMSLEGGAGSSQLEFTLIAGQTAPACATFSAASPIVVVDTAGNGNSNSVAEPGESAVALTLPLGRNAGGGVSAAIVGTLESLTPTVTVVSGTSSYPNMNLGSVVNNVTPFIISVDPSHPCQSPMSLRLTVSTDGGLGHGVVGYSVSVGSAPGTFTITRTNIAASIPDADPQGVSATFVVTGVTSPIADVDFRFDGSSTSSSATVGSTGLGHANVGDLVITLISPHGTSVTLVNQAGSPGASTSNNFRQLILDDGAPALIQEIGSPTGPITGSFKPANVLSAVNGEDPNGTWVLQVADVVANTGAGVAGGEGGWLRNASLIINSTGGCRPPLANNVFCCRGTTCNSVPSGTCVGTVAGSQSLVVSACGAGNVAATCCYADFNQDGTPSIDDLFLYLNAYFTASPWANVNGDGIAAPTIDDLFLFINAYFVGCG